MNARPAIACFLFLCFGLCWVIEIPSALAQHRLIHLRIPQGIHILSQFSPAMAAILTAGLFEGRGGLRRLFASLLRIRTPPLWYGFALLVPLMMEGAIVLTYWMTRHAMPPMGRWYDAFWVAVLMTPFFCGEELGWRGYLLDRVLRRTSPVIATLWVALAWGLWHLPWYLAQSTGLRYVLFAAGVIPASALFTLVYWKTRSLLPCMLLHSAFDIGAGYFLAPIPDVDWAFAALSIAAWVFAIPVFVILSAASRIRPEAVRSVPLSAETP